jgi:hypothetical protein
MDVQDLHIFVHGEPAWHTRSRRPQASPIGRFLPAIFPALRSLGRGGLLTPGPLFVHACAMETTKADFCVFARVRNSVIASCEALLHRPPGPKFGCQERARGVYPNILATGEHVNCRVAILRPDVDCKMRFRNNDDAGDAPRSKFMEHRLNDGRPGGTRRIHKGRLNPRYVIKAIRLAFIQIEYDLGANGSVSRGLACRRNSDQSARHVGSRRINLERLGIVV